MDHLAICRQALGTLRRRGVCQWIEADELLSVGCLAILEAGATDEALAVVVARRAMISAVRKNERRERGRVEPVTVADNGDVADADQWDALVASHEPCPENHHVELWEGLKALPAREYRAITLLFWGGKSQAEIAEEMGVGQQQVSRIIASAKKNLSNGCVNPDVRAMNKSRGKEAKADCSIGQHEAA